MWDRLIIGILAYLLMAFAFRWGRVSAAREISGRTGQMPLSMVLAWATGAAIVLLA